MKSLDLTPWPEGQELPPIMCGEDTRLSVLADYGLDALEDDPELAEISSFAATLCGAPIAMVSLVEAERQRFLAKTGIAERETPRTMSFCAHAMLEPQPMVISDAREDPRFAGNALVTGHPHIRFYAGAPLISHEGAPLGALCVIDTAPRPEGLTPVQLAGLEVLASSVMRRLRHRRENLVQAAEFKHSERTLRAVLDSIPDIAWSADAQGNFDYFNARWQQHTGKMPPREAADWAPFLHPDDAETALGAWYSKNALGQAFEAEYRMQMADGSFRWVLSRATPFSNSSGEVDRWFGTVTDIDENRRRLDTRELISRELSHRIKNIFAVIGGLIALKSREYPETAEFAADVTATLHALNRAHGYVTQDTDNTGETLHGLLEKLMRPYGDRGGSRFTLEGEDVPVSAKSATPLALVFHELATNSAKYGSFSVAAGKVAISTSMAGDEIVLLWRERSGPAPADIRKDGFGSRLVERSVSSQLAGTLTRSFDESGLLAVLTLPRSGL